MAPDASPTAAASPSLSPSPSPTLEAPNSKIANRDTATEDKTDDKSKKRAATGDNSDVPQKITKRRAARACVSCRARKVRCDVVEGAPCGNCRWDNVEVRVFDFMVIYGL